MSDEITDTIISQMRYLNTDLEIESPDDLTPIADAFGEDVTVMYNGKWGEINRASFETASYHDAVNETIEYFCSLVEAFDKEERALWDSCFSRVFDIGYETGMSPPSFGSEISQNIIKRLAAINGSIRITIYPPFSDKRPTTA